MENIRNLELVGTGATAKVYRDGDRAVKLYEHASIEDVQHEADAQRFAHDAGLPVPAVYGVRALDDGMVALDMAYAPGTPLAYPGMDKDERRRAILKLVGLQTKVQGVTADGLPKQVDKLTWKIMNNPHLDVAIKELLLAEIACLDRRCRNLSHGDFHVLNVLTADEQVWIIDWVDASAGNPSADACRTYLLFLQYMLRSSGIYLQAYCKEAGVPKEEVLAWLPIVAAARMSERLSDQEREFFRGIVDEWYLSKARVRS